MNAEKPRKTGTQKLAIAVAIIGGLMLIAGVGLFLSTPDVNFRGETVSCGMAPHVDLDNSTWLTPGATSATDLCSDAESERNTQATIVSVVGLVVLLAGLVMITISHTVRPSPSVQP